MKSQLFLGTSAILGATFCYGFFGIFTRLIGYSLPIYFAYTTRLLLGTLILFLLVIITKQWKKLSIKHFSWISLRSFIGLFSFLLSYTAFYRIPISSAYLIFYSSSTIAGYCIGKLLYKEQLNPVKIISLISACIGLAITYSFSIQPDLILFAGAAALSGVCTSLWNTMSKKVAKYPPTQLNFLDFIISFIVVFFISLIAKEQWVAPQINSLWMSNILFGLLFVISGQLIIIGFNRVEAQTGSIIMLSEVIFGTFFAFVAFQEPIYASTILGGGCIAVSLILPYLSFSFSRKKQDYLHN